MTKNGKNENKIFLKKFEKRKGNNFEKIQKTKEIEIKIKIQKTYKKNGKNKIKKNKIKTLKRKHFEKIQKIKNLK